MKSTKVNNLQSNENREENKTHTFSSFFENNKEIKYSLLAVLFSFIIGIFVMIFVGQFYQIDDYLAGIFTYNFGSIELFARFLGNLGWMIAIGLSVGVAFRAGLFNIGSAGQMMAGGLTGFLFASNANIGHIGIVFSILLPIIVGSLVAILIGILKVRFNINIVISSIMLNWVIFYILKFTSSSELGSNYILADNSLRMEWFSGIFNLTSDTSIINIGIIISLLLVPLFAYLYKRTVWGYKQDIIGKNIDVSTYVGLNKEYEILKTMAISGALAGLAGSIYYVGVLDTIQQPETLMSIPGETFNGIAIALIGFNSPLGILASSMLITALTVDHLDGIIGSMHITDLIIGITIILLAISHYFIYYSSKKPKIKTNTNIKINDNSSTKDGEELSKEKIDNLKAKESDK